MKTQSNIQSIADDFYIVSNTRPTATRNHQQWSHLFKPSVVKLQRRHRHQSRHTKVSSLLLINQTFLNNHSLDQATPSIKQ